MVSISAYMWIKTVLKTPVTKKTWLTFSWIWWILAHFELFLNFIATWSWEKTKKLKIPEIYVGCISLIIGCKHTSLRVFHWSFRCPRPSLHITSLLESKHESAITNYWPFGKTLQNSLQHKAKGNNYRFEWIRNPPSPTYWHQIWKAVRACADKDKYLSYMSNCYIIIIYYHNIITNLTYYNMYRRKQPLEKHFHLNIALVSFNMKSYGNAFIYTCSSLVGCPMYIHTYNANKLWLTKRITFEELPRIDNEAATEHKTNMRKRWVLDCTLGMVMGDAK